jgi:hypothetical protein
VPLASTCDAPPSPIRRPQPFPCHHTESVDVHARIIDCIMLSNPVYIYMMRSSPAQPNALQQPSLNPYL